MLNVKPSWKNWQLLTEKGRQIWAFKPKSNNINEHLLNVASVTDEDIIQFAVDFQFDKSSNPNSGDKVFRHAAINANFQEFSGQPPQESNADQQQVTDALVKGINYFSYLQSEDGHWPGDYGGPLFLLPGLLIASYLTESPFPKAHQEMMKLYIFNHQNSDAGWGMHIEGESTMFGTVMQYVSLRLLGVDKSHEQLASAREWIKNNGGATGIPSWGKFYLAILNCYDWQGFNSLFPEMWLFPKWLPVHPWRYWCHSRMVYLPMAYCYAQRIKAPETALILSLREEIFNEDFASIDWPKQRNALCEKDSYTQLSPVLKWMNFFTNTYEKFKSTWLREKATAYLLKYLNAEDAQTDYINIGPVNKAINSISIWHAYGKDSEQFKKHVARWYDYLWIAEDGMKMNGYNGSQLWDTAFATRAILESDLGKLFPETIAKSYKFIELSQIKAEHPTHGEFFRHPMIGSWPFSTAENGWPVADCTAEGLSATLAINHSGLIKPIIDEQRIQQAVDVILSYQNADGGWATYELSRAPKWLEKLNPSEVFADIMIDYSWTECTAACVISLLEIQETYPAYKNSEIRKAISSGIEFILNQQKSDGSWYGGWAVCFTYATWFGVEAISKAKGKSYFDDAVLMTSINKACSFLVDHQKADGGWGETFESCSKLVYSEAADSQVVNTAWALLTLMAAEYGDNTAIDMGINVLLNKQVASGDWSQESISGVFNYNCMITYANYRNIFPIWALSRYRQRFASK
ncbi:MAG: terpene cyclase/mutase family protein [Methylococcaceae bacterium]|nr:terpene cyclase/mutase family protein [Methylococcaceae bacterium]MDZ4156241.1 terpene cyclase/mutase family protein [Methylococcales bacterium]MDP2393819.1 terpene cyclase/mutase family protein [Methylococcaceae bacterium]MDP3019845.1 terpene cyclase/mutase family protein [Methylococcaceae bacterium]MDP3389550.1 terpene cyclase/mutase family protein [Methylococcaceae bacterium]